MTKEITKAYILQEIQDKFKLRELAPEVFSFSETVVPVYNVEEHLKKWETITKTVVMSSATGFLFFTVPDDETWSIRAYQLLFLASGAYTVSGMYMTKRPSAAISMYLDLKAGQSVSYLVNLPVVVRLHPGTQLFVLVDGYTSTASLKLNVDVQKEKIR